MGNAIFCGKLINDGSRSVQNLAASCGVQKKYEIKGRIEGLTHEILLTLGDEEINRARVSTDGSFTIKGRFTRSEVVRLADRDADPFLILLLQPGTTVITGDLENLPGTIKISGDPLNERLLELSNSLGELHLRGYPFENESEQSAARMYDSLLHASFEENRSNILGAFIFSSWMCDGMETNELESILSDFPAEIREAKVLDPARNLLALRERTDIGSRYTEVILPDETRFDTKLSAVLKAKKYVLLHFWALWSQSGMDDLPGLVEVHRKYQQKGFEVYAVSLDSNRDEWISSIGSFRLRWINVGSFGRVANDAVFDYGVETLPMNFLISHDGVIVAKNLRPAELEIKLTGLLDMEKITFQKNLPDIFPAFKNTNCLCQWD